MGWKKLLGKSDGPSDPDGQVLLQLQQHGADLTVPRNLEHFLYLPSEAAAVASGESLSSFGYATTVKSAEGAAADDPYPWIVIATIETIVDADRIREERQRFEALANEHGGDYDGWGASV